MWMDTQTHIHSYITETHTVMKFFLPSLWFRSPDYMTLYSVAEHFLEVMSWKDYTRAVRSTSYGVRGPKFKSHLSIKLDL